MKETKHKVTLSGQFCTCGMDAVTCQTCGHQVCGSSTTWITGKGNLCPTCLSNAAARDVRETRTLPVRELTARECRALLVHSHEASSDRRKAYLLKSTDRPEAYYGRLEQEAIRAWMDVEPAHLCERCHQACYGEPYHHHCPPPKASNRPATPKVRITEAEYQGLVAVAQAAGALLSAVQELTRDGEDYASTHLAKLAGELDDRLADAKNPDLDPVRAAKEVA